MVCQGLVVPVKRELEARDLVKVDVWTHYKLDEIGRRLSGDIVFPTSTLVVQCLLSWLCVAIQLYLTYMLLRYATDDGKEQARRGSTLEKLAEQIAELKSGQSLADIEITKIGGELPEISGRQHVWYLLSLLVLVFLTAVDVYQHVLFIAVCVASILKLGRS